MLDAKASLGPREFQRIRELLFAIAGISLGDGKEALVAGRLHRRLGALALDSYADYVARIESPEGTSELQVAIDLLTTNETYFWREPAHFEALLPLAREAARARREFRVWSAASSTGEEAYSIAMVLDRLSATERGLRWSILGSDISTRVLERARLGHYAMDRAARLPQELMHRYCLKGHGPQAGTLLVDRALRERCRFVSMNLIEPLPDIGLFDAIFLRNVLIYFEPSTKAQVLRAVATRLAPGGRLFVGLSESLHGVAGELQPVGPGTYALGARR